MLSLSHVFDCFARVSSYRALLVVSMPVPCPTLPASEMPTSTPLVQPRCSSLHVCVVARSVFPESLRIQSPYSICLICVLSLVTNVSAGRSSRSSTALPVSNSLIHARLAKALALAPPTSSLSRSCYSIVHKLMHTDDTLRRHSLNTHL